MLGAFIFRFGVQVGKLGAPTTMLLTWESNWRQPHPRKMGKTNEKRKMEVAFAHFKLGKFATRNSVIEPRTLWTCQPTFVIDTMFKILIQRNEIHLKVNVNIHTVAERGTCSACARGSGSVHQGGRGDGKKSLGLYKWKHWWFGFW